MVVTFGDKELNDIMGWVGFVEYWLHGIIFRGMSTLWYFSEQYNMIWVFYEVNYTSKKAKNAINK